MYRTTVCFGWLVQFLYSCVITSLLHMSQILKSPVYVSCIDTAHTKQVWGCMGEILYLLLSVNDIRNRVLRTNLDEAIYLLKVEKLKHL